MKQIDENKKIMSQMKAMGDNLKSGNILDLICDIESNLKIVMPSYLNYFFNSNMNEIIDGKYKVLGKVSRDILNADDEINLLRNTSFSLIQHSMLETLFSDFASLEENGLHAPNISTVVRGPALMVIPIAIFL